MNYAILPPIGTLVPYAGTMHSVKKLENDGAWLLCDGRALQRETYPELYEAIGDQWGPTGQSSFRLPDLRGLFLRGVSLDIEGATDGPDPDKARRTVGSVQPDALKSHAHGYVRPARDGNRVLATTENNGNPRTDGNTDLTEDYPSRADGPETRPVNAAVFYLIRAK